MAPRIERVAAGIVERQAQAEGQAFAHLGNALLDLLGREQIEPAELVVGAEIPPCRSFGPLLPALLFGHRSRSPVRGAVSITIAAWEDLICPKQPHNRAAAQIRRTPAPAAQ